MRKRLCYQATLSLVTKFEKEVGVQQPLLSRQWSEERGRCRCARVRALVWPVPRPFNLSATPHRAMFIIHHGRSAQTVAICAALFSEDDQNTSTTIVLLIYNVSFKLLFLFFFSLPHCRVIAHISHAVLIQATLLQAIVRNCPWRWRRAWSHRTAASPGRRGLWASASHNLKQNNDVTIIAVQ